MAPRLSFWIQKTDQAEPLIRESDSLFEEVFAADPEKADYKQQLTTALCRLGTLRDLQRHAVEAVSLFERCRQLPNKKTRAYRPLCADASIHLPLDKAPLRSPQKSGETKLFPKKTAPSLQKVQSRDHAEKPGRMGYGRRHNFQRSQSIRRGLLQKSCLLSWGALLVVTFADRQHKPHPVNRGNQPRASQQVPVQLLLMQNSRTPE